MKGLTDPHLVDDLIIEGANQNDTSLPHAMSSKAKADKASPWELASKLTGQPSQKFIEATDNRLIGKIEKGLETPNNQSILHTAPHHDEIELAYFPFLHHLVRSTTNSNHFVYLTSGFTAVTNFYVKECIDDLIQDLQEGRLQELENFTKLNDIFPQYPNYETDVKPLLELFEAKKPSIITLALDPEGSGPDTHYKSLIALSDAIDMYMKNNPDLNLRIWEYRNVWSRYKPTEAERIITVSLNSFATLHNMFNNCFVSQKSASFPSYELNGTFSQLAKKFGSSSTIKSPTW